MHAFLQAKKEKESGADERRKIVRGRYRFILKRLVIAVVIAVVIVAQSTTAFALEYTTETDYGPQQEHISMNAPEDITQKSNLTPDMFEALLPPDLKGLGQAFWDGEQLHNLNGLFVLSIIRLESGNGTSHLARTKNNLGGIKSGDSAYRTFASKDECVAYMFDLLDRRYISQGKTSIAGIAKVYCETGGWAPQVTSIMDELIKTCAE